MNSLKKVAVIINANNKRKIKSSNLSKTFTKKPLTTSTPYFFKNVIFIKSPNLPGVNNPKKRPEVYIKYDDFKDKVI